MSRSSYVEPTALGLVLAALQPTNRLVFEVMLAASAASLSGSASGSGSTGASSARRRPASIWRMALRIDASTSSGFTGLSR